MSDDYRELAIRQSSHFVSSALAGKLRDRTPKPKEIELPQPSERPAVRAAEALVHGQPPDPGESMDELATGAILADDSLFADVEDRVEAKRVLLAALRSKAPVHVLMEGDPASGKSQLLQCIARLPHSRYAVGGMTSSSGMVDYLLERRSTQILVIDELDKCETEDYAALYSLMESGTVPRLQHGKTEVLRSHARIFAACNSTARMPEALISRFVYIKMRPYTVEESRAITEAVLRRREGLSPARAKAIAERVSTHSRDPRDGVQLARLAGEDGDLELLSDQVVAKSRRNG